VRSRGHLMFWRSVVGKLAITILLLVSFVLFILSILLLEFFENLHVQEAEKVMLQTASKVSEVVEEHDEKSLIMEMVDRVTDPTSRGMVYVDEEDKWISDTNNPLLQDMDDLDTDNNEVLQSVLNEGETYNDVLTLDDKEKTEIMVIGASANTRWSYICIRVFGCH